MHLFHRGHFVLPILLLLTIFSIHSAVQAAPAAEIPDEAASLPPTITITNISDGQFINRDITPRVSIKSRLLKNTAITIDGSPLSPETPVTTEGTHVIEVTAEDERGQKASLRRTFTIDKTPPETAIKASSFTASDTALVFVTGKAVIQVEAKDRGAAPSGVAFTECQMDGGTWKAYRGPIPLAGMSEGTHTVICRSTDNAGNMEEERKLPLAVSNFAPTTVLNLSPPFRTLADGTYMASSSTTFNLFASGSRVGVATTQYQIDDRPWQTTTPFSIAEEGKHVIRYKSLDRLGNEEPAKTATVVIDNRPPRTKVEVKGATYTNAKNLLHVSPAAVFRLTAESGAIAVSKTEYRIDNREWLHYEPFSITEEGQHLVEYRSIDEVGNAEKEQKLQVVIDAGAPLTVITIDDKKVGEFSSVIYTRGKNTISFTADDFLAGVKKTEYRIDGGKWKSELPVEVNTKDSHKIEFRSIDHVGNEEETKAVTLKVDGVPPVSTLEISGPHTVANSIYHVTDKTVLTFGATDTLSGVAKTEYRIDDGGWRVAAPFSISLPGAHKIEVRSTDTVGNEEKPRGYQIRLDTAAPVTIVSTEGRKGFNDGTLHVTGTTPISLSVHSPAWGVKSTEFRVDGGAWSDYRKPFTVADEGKHVLEFRSSDKGGNEESMRTVDVVVDNSPPVSTIRVGIPSKEVSGSVEIEPGTLLTPSATDAVSGVSRLEYQIKGQPVERDGVPFSIASKGTYEISYWSMDRAGNREKPKNIRVVVTNAPKQFTADDIKLSTELATPPEEKLEQAAALQAAEPKVENPPPPLPDPPPDPEPPPRPPPEKKNPLMKWTVNFLQAVMIIGVMLF